MFKNPIQILTDIRYCAHSLEPLDFSRAATSFRLKAQKSESNHVKTQFKHLSPFTE